MSPRSVHVHEEELMRLEPTMSEVPSMSDLRVWWLVGLAYMTQDAQ
jgi:hypothetical protein